MEELGEARQWLEEGQFNSKEHQDGIRSSKSVIGARITPKELAGSMDELGDNQRKAEDLRGARRWSVKGRRISEELEDGQRKAEGSRRSSEMAKIAQRKARGACRRQRKTKEACRRRRKAKGGRMIRKQHKIVRRRTELARERQKWPEEGVVRFRSASEEEERHKDERIRDLGMYGF